MSPEQAATLQRSFAHVRRIGPIFAATFYRELFAVSPDVRVLFKGDMIQQGAHLTDALTRIVDGVAAQQDFLPEVRALAVRHVGYGVEARHYIAFATALMRTLRHELASEFTQPVREAWAEAIKLLTEAILDAAYGARAARLRTA